MVRRDVFPGPVLAAAIESWRVEGRRETAADPAKAEEETVVRWS